LAICECRNESIPQCCGGNHNCQKLLQELAAARVTYRWISEEIEKVFQCRVEKIETCVKPKSKPQSCKGTLATDQAFGTARAVVLTAGWPPINPQIGLIAIFADAQSINR
jgi:hypothetical protein